MHRSFFIIAALLAAFVIAQPADAGDSFILRAGRVMPVSNDQPWVIHDGVIVVRDGVIEAIGGSDMDLPPDLPLIDMPAATVMPGLVAASTAMGGEHSGEESIGAGYDALDAYNQYGDYRRLLQRGVTTVHLNPGRHRLVSGRGAVVKLDGDNRVLLASGDVTMNLSPRVYSPPAIVELVVPSSADQQILPAVPQRPDSRMTQFMAITDALERSKTERGDYHLGALASAWAAATPLRMQTDRSADIAGAVAFLAKNGRAGYLVGGTEAVAALEAIVAADVPLVYTIPAGYNTPGPDIGFNPGALESDLTDLGRLSGVTLALATSGPTGDLRLAAAMARRGGLDEEQAVRAVTSVAATILGVDDRVGRLAPGMDADLLVLNGDPLDARTSVLSVYVGGEAAYSAAAMTKKDDDHGQSLVVKAGTIWLGPGEWLSDGEVLIEDGRIAAVGRRVPQPAGAAVVDAGADAFVAPGFIDALGHLGLEGDRAAPAAELSLSALIGAPDVTEARVARAGVTTVMMAPYRFGSNGSQISAIKTQGASREARVVEATAALAWDIRGGDPTTVAGRIKPKLEAGKAYLAKWEKYRQELAEWEKQKAEGKVVKKEETVEETETEATEDPITGTWQITITGEQLPEPAEAKIGLSLKGDTIDGRILDPAPPVDVAIGGKLDGTRISGTIDVDTGGAGIPEWEGELDAPDHSVGKIRLGGFLEVDYEMTRIDKGPVEFKLVSKKRKTRGKDGRPLPPKIDEALEPIRAVLEKRIPVVISAGSPYEIEAALAILVDEYELSVVLLGGEEATRFADQLSEKGVGVVLPPAVLRPRDDSWYHQGDDLNRQGVAVAFQSDAEDGARTLPQVGLYAVEQGMSPEAALAAFTVDPARMYGLEDRVGAIAAGCDGDLLIFSGHPFEAGSTLERVIINGEEVER